MVVLPVAVAFRNPYKAAFTLQCTVAQQKLCLFHNTAQKAKNNIISACRACTLGMLNELRLIDV